MLGVKLNHVSKRGPLLIQENAFTNVVWKMPPFCLGLNVLTKPPLKLGHGRVITSHPL